MNSVIFVCSYMDFFFFNTFNNSHIYIRSFLNANFFIADYSNFEVIFSIIIYILSLTIYVHIAHYKIKSLCIK